MVNCEKGHENPDGAIFCKECGIRFDVKFEMNIISYSTSFNKLSLFAKIILVVFSLSVILGIIGIIVDAHEFFDDNLFGVLSAFSFVLSFLSIIVLFVKGNFTQKGFTIPLTFSSCKETTLQFLFSENKKHQNEEKFRIKTLKDNTIVIYDTTIKERHYLSADKNNQAIMIGQRDTTIELIRVIFGDQWNFIEK